jgi:hypothetical protein
MLTQPVVATATKQMYNVIGYVMKTVNGVEVAVAAIVNTLT